MRALHLHHDGSSVAQLGRVDLAKARRAKWRLFERREQLAESPAQLVLNDVLDLIDRDLIDVVLKFFELVDVGPGNQIRSRRENLSELDVSRAQLDESF